MFATPFIFGFTPEGTLALLMRREFAENIIMLQQEYEDSAAPVHRTPVEDMEADIFDRLEVEMANDKVVENAASNSTFNSVMMADQIRQQLANDAPATEPAVRILFTSPELYNSYLMFFNTLYTYARRGDVEGFVVGTAQGDDDFEQYDVPELTRSLMAITSVLADVGISAARTISEADDA